MTPNTPTDRECLEAWSLSREAQSLRPVVERYLPLIYASALRRTGDADAAADVARAVFLVLARRARKLRKTKTLAAWLFDVAAVACRKLKRKRLNRWRWFARDKVTEGVADTSTWGTVSPRIDAALDRLSKKQREAVLRLYFLNDDPARAAARLNISVRRVTKRAARGLKKAANRLHKRRRPVTFEGLATACAAEGCSAPLPQDLTTGILRALEANGKARPAFPLARRTLASLAWARWRRRTTIAVFGGVTGLAVLAAAAWYVDSLTGHSRSIAAFLVWSVQQEGKKFPGLAAPARAWPTDERIKFLSAANVDSTSDLYLTTNIWQAHLKFSPDQWKALEPERIGALPHFLPKDGPVLLRNPKARRSGLAGVLGFDFQWSRGDLDFGGVSFSNVAVRFKGNGTYLGSLYGNKRALKVDLNKHQRGQKLGDADELTFNNLIVDHSYLSDALGYEFFRDAGVPSPRTAYAWLTVTVAGRWDRKPLGLYAMVEPVNGEFAAAHFGSKQAPIFKPVTYQLFEFLGPDWQAYEAIYDLKTVATETQKQRVIDFARLVSFSDDEEFSGRVGEFLDLGAFARFLAGQVLLSNYDSLLANGQNFYVYLDPRSNRFGFIPWDLDLAWGGFFLLATPQERVRASIWQPWVGENRFLERVMAVEEFRRLYRLRLEEFSANLFVADRLHARIDQLASIIHEPIAAESAFRLNKFEQAIGLRPVEPVRGSPMGANREAHQIKRFIVNRAASVRRQLDGKSPGMILKRGGSN